MAGPRLRGTTLLTAWYWGVAFSLACVSVATVDLVPGILAPTWSDLLWYVTAVTGLCPAIAVLGARRPGSQVWTLFVILPLLAVLGWPAMTVLMRGFPPQQLHLEAPPLVAFGLVLLMGYGNYVGTRFGWSVLLAAAGEGLLVAPVAMSTPDGGTFRALGLICVLLAAVLATVASRRSTGSTRGLGRVWSDFRNSFGVVWSRRIMERFNQQALEERWVVRLEPGGFVWGGDRDSASRESAEAERFLRWLLRRFVDEGWIDARMASGPAAPRVDD